MPRDETPTFAPGDVVQVNSDVTAYRVFMPFHGGDVGLADADDDDSPIPEGSIMVILSVMPSRHMAPCAQIATENIVRWVRLWSHHDYKHV